MKYYAGIGSRETPTDILELMSKIAQKLEEDGYTLRSGGADGADSAFAKSITTKEIYLPWKGFNKITDGIIGTNQTEALALASSVHPAWNRCSQGAKKLHTRNIYQVLGSNCDLPVDFVICWTKDGKTIGGTATAINIAKQNGIPVYNLAITEDRKHFEEMLKESI
jgi:hypothetical protein